MKLTTVLTVLIGMLVVACSSAAPAPVEPIPNIDATVEARVAQERAVDATVEARAKELIAEQPTATPVPTTAPLPKPTDTPIQQPTNTPTAVPAATSVPTPTPRPIPTATPVPTPTPVSYWCDGKTIRFKIGSVWANETIVFERGGSSQLNLTASSATFPKMNATSWPISASAQSVPPHVVVGNVSASDHTLISAWADGVQVATAVVMGGSYSMTIENQNCLVIVSTPTPWPPTPTPTLMPTPQPSLGYVLPCSGQGNDGYQGHTIVVGDIYGASPPMVVSAWISGVETNRAYLNNSSYYQFVIESCEDKGVAIPGAVVRFSIDGFWAEETIVIDFRMEPLNLTKTNDPVVIN